MSTEILSHALISPSIINCHVEDLITDTLTPESNIQSSQSFQTRVFNALLISRPTGLQRSTSTRDVLHFYTKLLDSPHYWGHHVALVEIQQKQWKKIFGCHFNVEFGNILNPFNHCPIIYPCIFLAIMLTARSKFWELFFFNLIILGSFEDKHWRQYCTICTHGYSHSGLFVSFVEVPVFTDFVPLHNIFFEWQVKKIVVWSMLIKNFDCNSVHLLLNKYAPWNLMHLLLNQKCLGFMSTHEVLWNMAL